MAKEVLPMDDVLFLDVAHDFYDLDHKVANFRLGKGFALFQNIAEGLDRRDVTPPLHSSRIT